MVLVDSIEKSIHSKICIHVKVEAPVSFVATIVLASSQTDHFIDLMVMRLHHLI